MIIHIREYQYLFDPHPGFVDGNTLTYFFTEGFRIVLGGRFTDVSPEVHIHFGEIPFLEEDIIDGILDGSQIMIHYDIIPHRHIIAADVA